MGNRKITKEEYLKAVEIVEEYHEQITREITEVNAFSNDDRPMVHRGDVIEITGRTNRRTNKCLQVGSQHIVSSEKGIISMRNGFLVFKCRGGLLIDQHYSYKITKQNHPGK